MELTDKNDLSMAMSEFSMTLTKLLSGLIRMRQFADNYIDQHLQQIDAEKFGTNKNSFSRNNNIANVDFDNQLDLWLTNWKDFLKEVEIFSQKLSWKLFRGFNNHLYIFRSPIIREDCEIRLPICNITFPEDKLNNLTHAMPKKRNNVIVKTNRCRRNRIPNVCGKL